MIRLTSGYPCILWSHIFKQFGKKYFSFNFFFFLQRLYFIFLILIGWLLFAFEDLSAGILYAKIMFGMTENSFYNQQFFYNLYTNIILLSICSVASTPILKKCYKKLVENNYYSLFIKLLFIVYLSLIMVISTSYLVDNSFNPFLYFRF